MRTENNAVWMRTWEDCCSNGKVKEWCSNGKVKEWCPNGKVKEWCTDEE